MYPNIRHRTGTPFLKELGSLKMKGRPADLSEPWAHRDMYAPFMKEMLN